MSEHPDNHSPAEELVRPIPRSSTPGDVRPPVRRGVPWWPIALGMALIALVAVFVLLPDGTQPPAPAATALTPVDAVPEAAATALELTPAEREALEAEAQRALAELLRQQDSLAAKAAPRWGEAAWEAYGNVSRTGDDAYLADDLAAALDAYRQALALGEDLLLRADGLFADAVAAGTEALLAERSADAVEFFDAALAISPEDSRAAAGRQRSVRQPEVLALMRTAREAEADGDLPAAIGAYRDALALDPDWQPAQAALASAAGNLSQYNFEQQLAAAYGELNAGRFAAAIAGFEAAVRMQPRSQAAAAGLQQAEEGMRSGRISLARVRAMAFTAREMWPEAIEQFQSALEIDSALEFALLGLAEAQARRDLDLKLDNLITNPALMFDDRILADAERLLEEARAVSDAGPRMAEQVGRLSRLLSIATAPLPLPLMSDNLTEVTIYRVGTIGRFTNREVRLRPGEYTLIGTRNGYRDVRREVRILPGETAAPIEIICSDPI